MMFYCFVDVNGCSMLVWDDVFQKKLMKRMKKTIDRTQKTLLAYAPVYTSCFKCSNSAKFKGIYEFNGNNNIPVYTLDQFLLIRFIRFGSRKKAESLWQCVVYTTMWSIWLEGTLLTFNYKFLDKQALWDTIQCLASIWCKAHDLYGSKSFSSLISLLFLLLLSIFCYSRGEFLSFVYISMFWSWSQRYNGACVREDLIIFEYLVPNFQLGSSAVLTPFVNMLCCSCVSWEEDGACEGLALSL
ncbi:hypothetical protein Ahy_B08g089643 isoform B [Arachis hypogaea]|uniref:Uncharacterized protein n=1 Tax=Arachis hypogaea TaxID=3818 RepID=A0A444XYI7_ARAHY|nr:hypothetical protein Ahy_B08g089643 isoform B [Arachis hypogaea]